jgi:hypothetical protein
MHRSNQLFHSSNIALKLDVGIDIKMFATFSCSSFAISNKLSSSMRMCRTSRTQQSNKVIGEGLQPNVLDATVRRND